MSTYKFIYEGIPHEGDQELMPRMHRAIATYTVQTGRVSTHLVLGGYDLAQYRGYLMHLSAMGSMRVVAEGADPAAFCGHQILRSAERSFCMAVELEEKRK